MHKHNNLFWSLTLLFFYCISIYPQQDTIKRYFLVKKDDKYGVVNRIGKEILPIKYDEITQMESLWGPWDHENRGLFRIKLGNKYGVCDSLGNVLTEAKYNRLDKYILGLSAAYKDEGVGYVNKKGDEVVSVKYDLLIRAFNGLYIIYKNDKFGAMDSTGTVIIPPKYESYKMLDGFVNNSYFAYAAFKLNKKWGVITNQGKILIPFEFDNIDILFDDFILVEKDGLKGVMDNSGRLIMPVEYDTITNKYEIYGNQTISSSMIIDQRIFKMEDKYFIYGKNNIYGVYNNYFKCILPAKYDNIETYFVCNVKDDRVKIIFSVQKNGKCGLADSTGHLILQTKYEMVYPYTEDMAKIYNNGKYGFIDLNQNVIIPCIFEIADEFEYGTSLVNSLSLPSLINKKGEIIFQFDITTFHYFWNSKSVCKKNNKFGYLSKAGNEILKFEYDEIKQNHFAFLKICKNGKWGVADSAGALVIPIVHDSIEWIKDEINCIIVNNIGKCGLYDLSGKLICQPEYDKIEGESESLFAVKKDGLWGVINRNGKIIVPILAEEVFIFSNNDIRVKKNGKYGIIDCNNNIVLPFIYDNIEILRTNDPTIVI